MKRRIRRLVLALAAVVAVLSINFMSLQAGEGGGESCGFCTDELECAEQAVVDMCIQLCDDLPDECVVSSPLCLGPFGHETRIECHDGFET